MALDDRERGAGEEAFPRFNDLEKKIGLCAAG